MTRGHASLPLTAGLAAVAGLGFHRVFGWSAVLPVVAVASVVPTVLAGLISGARRGTRWPLWLSVLLTLLAWAATVSLTLFRGRLGDGAVPGLIGRALRDSWKAILTTLLPAPARPELLVLVHVAVWLGAFAGAEIALRTSPRVLPCVPALVVFAVALVLGVGGPGSNGPPAAAAVALIAALALLRAGGAGAGVGPRRYAAGIPGVAVLAALALLAAPYAPVSGDPYDPREQVQAPPPQRRDGVSPLDRVGAWLLSPDQVLFTVRSRRAENWRLAVLDRFDGVTWTSGARFVPTGGRVPPDPVAGSRREADQQITINDLPGVWVPAADRPRTVQGLGVVADPGSGALAAARPLRPGQAYRVTSSVRQWAAGELADAVPAGDPEARSALELPNGPGAKGPPPQLAEFRALAQEATRGAVGPIEQAAMLSRWLKTHARYDVTAAPGHNYRQLDYFLGESRRGTPEHFATSYAVLARTLGLPTRVVVGFRPGRPAGDVRQVRSGDVLVWPEVRFTGLGWVPFFPTPERTGRSKDDGSVAAGETLRKLEQEQQNAATRRRGAGTGRTDQVKPPAARVMKEEPTPWGVYALPPAGALLLGYATATLTARARRGRRRRNAATQGLRVTGAWHHVLEHLGDVGLADSRTLTAHEVARYGVDRLGPEAAAHLPPLADLVNRAGFAGSGPDAGAAEEAWRHCDATARLVKSKVGAARRLGRRLGPRSLHPRPGRIRTRPEATGRAPSPGADAPDRGPGDGRGVAGGQQGAHPEAVAPVRLQPPDRGRDRTGAR